jgi:hypothetical protein
MKKEKGMSILTEANTVPHLIFFCLCRRVELVFAEERKRASERIISLTKHNERKMKDVIIAMDLS